MFLVLQRSLMLIFAILVSSVALACIPLSDLSLEVEANAQLKISCQFWHLQNDIWQAGESSPFEQRIYNSSAQLLTSRRFLGDGTLSFTEKYSYENGLLSSVFHLDANNVNNWRRVYFYDSEAKVVKQEIFGATNNLDSIREFSYKNGQLVSDIEYAFDGALLLRQTYHYNTAGNLEQIDSFGQDDILSEQQKISYENGLIKLKEIYSEGTQSQLAYSYEQDKLREKRLNSANGNLISYWQYEYNDQTIIVTQFNQDKQALLSMKLEFK